MPPLYARVGEQLAKGKNITEATKEGTGDAEASMMADRDEDFNTRYAVYRGYVMAYERTKLIPRRSAEVSLTRMITAAHAETVDAVVDHFIGRLLRVSLAPKDRAVLVDFLREKLHGSKVEPGEALEPALRELLYLVLSLPEYQLG